MKSLVAFVLLLGLSGVASAQESDQPAAPTSRPWAEGVSQERQAAALALFTEGTDLLKDAFFTRAVEKYKEALDQWDHPAIHFNMAKALMNLDNPVDAYKHLDSSMRYGGAPLDEDQVDQVKRYMKLLYDGELADLVVICQEPGAIVSLNGVEIFKGPGQWTGLVRAAQTTVLATKAGFQPAQVQKVLPKGQKTEISLTLIELESVTKYTRVMDAWKPWVVVGSGAVGLIAGGLFTWQASKSFEDYDKAIEICNAESAISIVAPDGGDTGGDVPSAGGCVPTKAMKDKESSGKLFQTLSIVSYVAGGATLATGIVLLYINRERPIKVEVPVEEPPVTFVPVIGPDGAGVTATMRF